MVALEDEWYEDVDDPARVVDLLRDHSEITPDIFTFWQRLPDIEPKYPFYQEWEDIAVLPVKSYDHWWNNQIKSRVRSRSASPRRKVSSFAKPPTTTSSFAG